MMNQLLVFFKPSSGFMPLVNKYLLLSGIGAASVLISEAFDDMEAAPYAAYYVGAVNTSFSPGFWDLLSVISLLLLCISLPLTYLGQFFSKLIYPAQQLRLFNQKLFFLTTDVGALALGILFIMLFQTEEHVYLQAWKELLLNGAGFFLLLWLLFLNSVLWLLGASIYENSDYGCSGVIAALFNVPVKIMLPTYIVIACAVIYLMASQQ
jgi:hypothetical protein